MCAELVATTRPAHEPARPRLADTGPEAGASVMATGIVSVGLSLAGWETLSRILLVAAAVLWVALAGLAARRFLRVPLRFVAEAGSPSALTAVAGTAVLGSRVLLLGWDAVAEAALALAFLLWLALVPGVLRAWLRPCLGVAFVLAVATESLGVLAAGDGGARRAVWLVVAALALSALGLVAYAFVLSCFEWRQLLTGPGDHWISGGALAIATLACADADRAAAAVRSLHALHGPLADAALALWAAAALWLPALLAAELARPRLRYDVRRWSTVFPLGMYAACSIVVGEDESIAGLVDFARVWIWIAFAVWMLAFAGLVRRAVPRA